MLIAFSGLPGTGKTTIARALAKASGAVYLRIDSIEQPMLRAGWKVEGVGYEVAHAVAEDNLRLGRVVIADCVNDWALTRDAWRAVGERAGAPVLEIEVTCSDLTEHRRRIETRSADITGQHLPTWSDVTTREYHAWNREHLIIDTIALSVERSVKAIQAAMLGRR